MLRSQSIPSVLGTILCCVFMWSTTLVFGQDTPPDSTSATPEEKTEEADAGASAGGLSTDAAIIAQGKGIFEGNCQQCHAVHEQVVGPKLAGIYERQSTEWLINFIKYPQKVIESGDAHAVELYNQYKQYMPNHDFLKDAEIMSILAYVQDETKKGPAVATAGGGEAGTTQAAEAENTGLLKFIIIGLAALLVLVLGVLVMLIGVLQARLKQDKLGTSDQEVLENNFSLAKIMRSPAFGGIVTFVFIAIVAKVVIEGIITIGVQQGYAPEQPIPFSHKLHAGKYEIDCKYCHTGVEKSKNANIPSLNICMNCHNSIRTTAPNIQKIYAYLENDEPVQWVRVHNLPDLAYFNHAQHVKVAGLDCENCHGPIQEMEIVRQSSLLTMGWCIDCHRETDVNAKGNEYYDNLLELHEAKGNKNALKVENIGGLECSKCHY